jgi:mitofusin
MFSKRRDSLARSISSNISLSDFVDITFPVLPWSSDKGNKSSNDDLASTASNALTLASVVGGSRLILQSDWLAHSFRAVGLVDFSMLRKLAIPCLVALGAWGVVYVVSDIPNALPRKMARRIRREIDSMDYVRANADRISKECRKVLRYPQQDIISAFQSNIERKVRDKEECAKSVKRADTANQHFVQFHKEAAQQRAGLSQINLDTPVIENI